MMINFMVECGVLNHSR